MVLIIRTERLNNPKRLFIGIICDKMKGISNNPNKSINGVYSKSLMVKIFE